MGRKDKSRARKQQGTNPAHESEAGYRRLVELSFDGIIVHEKGKIVFVNPSGAELLGAETPEQLFGKPILDFVHPDHQGIVEERVRKIRKGKEVPLIEEKFVRLDGTELDVEVIGTSITYEGNSAVQVVFRDITERVRSEEEQARTEEVLRESEERFRSLVEQTTDAVFCYEYDPPIPTNLPVEEQVTRFYEGVLVECNEVAARSYGATQAQEVIGKRLTDIFGTIPGSLDDFFSTFIRNGYRTVEEEGIEVLSDGTERYYANNGHGVVENGVLVRVWGTFRDITQRVRSEEERARAEEALQESEERYRVLSELTSDYATAIRVEPNGALTVEWVTEAFARITGLTLGEMNFPDDLARLIHPDDLSIVHDSMRDSFSGIPHETEYRIITNTGEIRWLHVHSQPVWSEEQNRVVRTYVAAQDITERVRSEEERARTEEVLRESEGRYRALVEQSLQGLVVIQDLRIAFANAAFTEISGYTVEELLSLSAEKVGAMIHPEDQALVWGHFRDRLEGKSVPQQYEYRGVRKDGTVRWLEMFASRIEYCGKPAIQGAIVDTTERVRSEEKQAQAEEALRESEEQFRNLAEQSPNMILINKQGRIVYANERCEKIMGYTRENFCSPEFDFLSLIAPESTELIKANFSRHAQGEDIPPYEYTIVDREGNKIETIITTKLITFEGGNAILGTITDITERKRLEHEIEERRLYLESVLASVPDAIVAMDAQHKILEWNPGAEKLFGYTQEETVGQDLDMLVAGPNTDKHDEATGLTQRFLSGESLPPIETVRYQKDGTPVNVLVSGSPIMLGDEMVGVVGVYTDITERVRSEEERARTEETMRRQEQLAAVGQLAGGIAHDFNNLLTTIMLYTQMPLGKPDLPSHAARALETILGESRQAAQLVQQILDFSRHSPIETRPVDLEPFVRDSVRILQRTIPESISLLLQMEPGEYIVNADPTRTQQVLMNLVVNARDAMPGGGKLTISLSRVELSSGQKAPVGGMPSLSPPPPAGEWICLSVSDTGTGIPPEALPHIYEPFFTTKPMGEGTGLGLAQVYGIVKQHEGHIGLETELGKGTTFRIYLPPHQAGEEDAPQEKAPAPAPGKGETILLVEDNERIRKAGREILESLGYQVLTAANGREALEVYRAAESVDLVLTDVVMPEMGGAELVRELVKVNPRLKALAVTGHLLAEEWEELNARGIIDVIYKPFNANDLGRMIRSALDLDED